LIEFCYNGREVILMTDKEALIKMIEKLDAKKITALKNLIETLFLPEEKEKKEALGFLKLSETSFSDWDNEEDDVYNDL